MSGEEGVRASEMLSRAAAARVNNTVLDMYMYIHVQSCIIIIHQQYTTDCLCGDACLLHHWVVNTCTSPIHVQCMLLQS